MGDRAHPGGTRGKLPVRATLKRVAIAYRAQWPLLISAAAVIFVPLSALEALESDVGMLDLSEDRGLRVAGAAVVILATFMISTLGNHFYSGLVGEAAAEIRTGDRRSSLREVLRSLPYLRLVAIDLVVTATVAGGLLLFVLPGVAAFCWLSLAAAVSTMEDLGVGASLRRSRELVRGSFWRVLSVLVALLILAEGATELLQAGLGAAAVGGSMGDWLGAAIVSAVIAPVVALATVVMAYELISLKSPSRG